MCRLPNKLGREKRVGRTLILKLRENTGRESAVRAITSIVKQAAIRLQLFQKAPALKSVHIHSMNFSLLSQGDLRSSTTSKNKPHDHPSNIGSHVVDKLTAPHHEVRNNGYRLE